jgi:chemotaxis protein MotB
MVTTRATSHDRWIVSYADFMTVLFAFFTVASTMPVVPAVATPEVSPPPPSAPVAADVLNTLRDDLTLRLRDAVSSARVDIRQETRGLVLSLPDAATFATGSAELRPDARTLIQQIVAAIQPLPLRLQVEGHTDDVPMRASAFNSNWELSSARANAVVAMLIAEGRFEPARLSSAGYGEFRPRVANTSESNRARNRRVDIVVIR